MKSNELADLILEWAKNRNGPFMTADAFREIEAIDNVTEASQAIAILYKKGLLAREKVDGVRFSYTLQESAVTEDETLTNAELGNPVIKRNPEIVNENHINTDDQLQESAETDHVAATIDQIQVGGDYDKNQAGIQPLSVIESLMSPDQFKGFLRGSVIKYIARCDKKGGLEDLKKARHYLDKLIEACANT
jgi:hypothetical protein